MARTEREILDEIKRVHCGLSPENLTCDGELTRAQASHKQKTLVARLRILEMELGRKPTEQEIWNAEFDFQSKPARPVVTTGVYLKLFHGRSHPNEEMNDWGTPGPVFGPFDFVHTTYASDLKMLYSGTDKHVALQIANDLIYYDGIYYGDWSVFNPDVFNTSDELKARHAPLLEEKSKAAKPAPNLAERVSNRERVFRLHGNEIVVRVTGESSGTITTQLHDEADSKAIDAAINAIESLILAHACAGVDVVSPAYQQGIETMLEAIEHHLG